MQAKWCLSTTTAASHSDRGPRRGTRVAPTILRDGIHFRHADLYKMTTLRSIVRRHRGKVVHVAAFPPCTDLAASGAAWWVDKANADPAFQTRAARHARRCAWAAEAMGTRN